MSTIFEKNPKGEFSTKGFRGTFFPKKGGRELGEGNPNLILGLILGKQILGERKGCPLEENFGTLSQFSHNFFKNGGVKISLFGGGKKKKGVLEKGLFSTREKFLGRPKF